MRSGRKLGPYEILEPLGAGGMGEVWLAEDTRLNRKVAIKVLPAEFASDPERRARFEQEARASAALNHPHIAVVHDIGSEVDEEGRDTHFMVQEYLQGHTLRTATEDGPLPLRQALALAVEIAEALNAAHRSGIVHRDLKPENIFVTEDGHAKVLDFGLAKLTEIAVGGSAGQSMSPTLLGTQAGAIMGTAGYMAPEQVQGQEIDTRADLFAFGCVLYELVSGKRAFSGQSLVQTLNRIVHEEPVALSELDAAVPSELLRIVRKCLAKSPARRYQSAADLAVDLVAFAADVEAGRAAAAVESVEASSGPASHRVVALAAGVGLVFGAAVVSLAVWALTRPEPRTPRRVGVSVQGPDSGFAGPPLVALSADGSTAVYTAQDGLYRRDLQHLEAQLIPGTEGGANTPFLSPDGAWLAFQGLGGLAKVSLSGGPVTNLCEGGVRGANWGSNDVIVYGGLAGGLMKVSAVGGDCTPLTTKADGEVGHYRPDVLPDGESVIFTIWSGTLDTAQLAIVSIDGGKHRLLGVNGSYPRYASTGHIVFARDASLWAVTFDLATLAVTGTPVPVLEGVRVEGNSGAAQFDISDNGSLLYAPGGTATGIYELVWVNRDGDEEPVGAPPGPYYDPAISPDGTRIALTLFDDAGVDVHIWDSVRQRLTRTTFDAGEDHSAVWSADGTRIAFVSGRSGGGVFQRSVDGTGGAVKLAEIGMPWVWAQDGALISSSMAATRVKLTPADRSSPSESLVGESELADRPALSPDGRWLAYEAADSLSGRAEIYVRPFPNTSDGLWQVSTGTGKEPKWSRDGSELFFRGPASIMVARIDTGPAFAASAPRPLFSVETYTFPPRARHYDVAPDGRFLMVKEVGVTVAGGEQALPGLVLVLDWFDELERLVPPSR